MPLTDPIIWYERHATQVVGSYEAVPAERLHRWLDGLLPAVPALVLDVGAGTGRDAAWFAGLGHDVVAVEPAAAMRAEATQLHPGPRIRAPDRSEARDFLTRRLWQEDTSGRCFITAPEIAETTFRDMIKALPDDLFDRIRAAAKQRFRMISTGAVS